jgi:hypothetical protein
MTATPEYYYLDGQRLVATDNNNDGTKTPHVISGNITTKFRDAFETYTPGQNWTQTLGSGDLVFVDGNAAAASYLVISKNPLVAGTDTAIESILTFSMPVEFAFGAHMSQRTLGQEFSVEIVDTGALIPTPADVAIDTIQQVTTTLTVTTITPHGLSVGRSIGIRSVADSRVNYQALVVATVPSPTQFTATAGPGGAIPSLSAYTTTVLAATTAALPTNTYANGTAGVGATLTATANGAFPAQDGISIPLGGRVLVKNEAAGANNGVYVLTQVGTAGTPWILTRATDLDTAAELTVVAGALFAVSVFVAQGATQAQREYYLSATVTTVGTTAVTWVDSGIIGPLGFVFPRSRLGQSQNGVSQIFENATATNASLYIRSESGDALPSGTIAGNHAATIGTTASVQLAGAVPYTYSFAPTNEFRILMQSDRTQWADSAVDAVAQTTSRLLRTQVCPDPGVNYELRIRATNNKSLTVPAAQIVSAVKAGTTTATVTTSTPHGMVTGDLVVAYGTRDQTNFANLATATAVASVISPTQFTIVWGAAVTQNTYGGYVARVQGGNLMSALGAVAQTAQSASLSTLSDGTRQLVLIGSAAWAAPATTIGDLVELVGVRDSVTGTTSLGVDGPWKIANVASSTLTLVLPFPSQRALPADFATTNCGGGVIRRTDLRLSFVRIFDYERERVEMLARPAGDMSAAAPVVLQGGAVTSVGTVTTVTTVSTVTAITGGGAAEDAAASANPLTVGGVVRSAVAPTTLIAGDAARLTMTTSAAAVVSPYSIPEVSWQTPANVGGLVNTATPLQIKEAAGALLRNYLTAIDLYSEALTNATDLRIREPDLTCASQTIASNTLTVSVTHNLLVGDAVVFTASTVTGISTGVTYYVLTVPSTTTITLSATRGGATLAISGTGVTATFHKVLWMQRIPTTGAAPRYIEFPVPLRGSINTAMQIQTATASGAGAVYASTQGFVAQ